VTRHWVFDLGNSRLKFAPLDADGTGTVEAVAHDGTAFAGEFAHRLPKAVSHASVASVAPVALREALAHALRERGASVAFAAPAARFCGIRTAYADPARLGVDRLLAMAAVHARAPATPALVVGVGTALTVDLVDGDGHHRGGRIAPSPALMRHALHARVPALPASGGDDVVFATGTADALASGCLGAALGLVLHSRQAAIALLDADVALWLHGGGAGPLRSHLVDACHVPSLVLDGLALWARGHGADAAG
jgi:type III pantothenate kinase